MPENTRRAISAATDDPRWAAVIARDASADGRFVFGVATTGIFCRPSCPSRRALRRNVRFFAGPADARDAGFRACKRCGPEEAATPTQSNAAGIRAACALIEAAETTPSLDELATAAGLSRFHFHRVFKAAMGVTPKQYASAVRQRRLQAELVSSPTVADAIYGAGYNSSSRFYETSAATLGMTASAYRANGAGETIRFALGDCSLGRVLVAMTEKGVCMIAFGDDDAPLTGDIERRFANATLVGPDAGLATALAAVVAAVDTPGRGLGLPLDMRGTAFQAQVWAALQAIPAGETISYGELARRIGKPSAVRAVAAACGANPVAVIVPCHRVIAADGKLTGYRWGIERKREILRRERDKRTTGGDET